MDSVVVEKNYRRRLELEHKDGIADEMIVLIE